MVHILDKVIGQHFWMPPGGEVDPGEDFYQTAERETREETGLIVRAYPETKVTKSYEFRFQDQLYQTTTHFFLCEFDSEDSKFNPRQREKYILASEWVDLKTAFDRMSPWEAIQAAVYELLQPLLRGRHGASFVELQVSAEESFQDDDV